MRPYDPELQALPSGASVTGRGYVSGLFTAISGQRKSFQADIEPRRG